MLLLLYFLLTDLHPGMERLYSKRLMAAEFSRIIDFCQYSAGVDAQTSDAEVTTLLFLGLQV